MDASGPRSSMLVVTGDTSAGGRVLVMRDEDEADAERDAEAQRDTETGPSEP